MTGDDIDIQAAREVGRLRQLAAAARNAADELERVIAARRTLDQLQDAPPRPSTPKPRPSPTHTLQARQNRTQAQRAR